MRRRMFWGSTSAYKYGYLTFIALEDGTFSYSTASQYTIDDGKHWIDLPANTSTPTIQAGSMISWRADANEITTFSSSNKFNIEGNPWSVKFGKKFKTPLAYIHLRQLFQNTKVVDASGLILPKNATCDRIYQQLFMNCSSLTSVPDLLLESVPIYGYYQMCRNCTSLVIAPKIYATTLGNSACRYMFYGCTSLTTASDFSPLNLSSACCMEMYRECSSLLSTTPLTLPATVLKNQCYAYMFMLCTNLQNAPELPAPILVSECYANMFQQTRVTRIKCLATNISATNCTRSWLYGVPKTGTFIKAAGMEDWTTGGSGIPTGWTIEDADV